MKREVAAATAHWSTNLEKGGPKVQKRNYKGIVIKNEQIFEKTIANICSICYNYKCEIENMFDLYRLFATRCSAMEISMINYLEMRISIVIKNDESEMGIYVREITC